MKGSDTLIPVRGRKQCFFLFLLSVWLWFRYLNPREGTETHFVTNFLYCFWFRYLNPREGTETISLLSKIGNNTIRSDTLIPVRGRKPIKPALIISLVVQIP